MKARGFYRKGKGMIHRQKKGISTRVNKLSYCLALHGWLLLPSSERMSLIISLCGQVLCFLCWFCKPLFVGQCCFAPIQSYFVQVSITEVQGTRHARKFLGNGCSDSITKWVSSVNFSFMLFQGVNSPSL